MFTPRDYQEAAFTAAMEAKENGRALIVLASGLGKTFVAAMLVRWWLKNAPIDKRRVLFIMHLADPLTDFRDDYFAPVFGDDIDASMSVVNASTKEDVDANVLFTTFGMMQAGELRWQFAPDEFGLVIVDEGHHVMAPGYREVVEHFTCDFRVGMTATPNRFDGKDISTVFGEEVYSYTLEQALAEGTWLADVEYHLVVDNIDIRKLRKLLADVRGGDRKISRKSIDSTIFLTEYTKGVVKTVKKWQKGGKQTIVFCRTIRHISQVHKHFPKAMPYHCKLSHGTRKARYDAFKRGEIQTLLVVDTFNEAIDVPDAELLVFLRATDSETVWRQQLGRGLRRTDRKRRVTVLDFVANCERLLMVHKFGDKIHFVRGTDTVTVTTGWQINFADELVDVLALLDELSNNTWDLRYEELWAYKERLGDMNVPWAWSENLALSNWIANQRSNYKDGILSAERIARLEALGFVWDPFESAWQKKFGELQAYKERFGTANVPLGWPENPELATWVAHQRAAYKTKTLPAERIAKLEALGFVWNTHKAYWGRKYKELKAYKKRFGDTNVPNRWTENPELGSWVQQQRNRYKSTPRKISASRIAKLNALGFVWDILEAAWQEKFEELKAYKKRFGDTNVPLRWSENPELGLWANLIRSSYKSKRRRISASRIAKLNALGFVWDILEAAWQEKFEELKAYKKRFGDTNVSSRWSENPELGRWVAKQRENYRTGTLSAKRVAKLEALGFNWGKPSSKK